MARFKPAGSKRAQAAGSKRGLIPCALLILSGFALMFWLLYELLKSGKA
jgi:hypothetical protein